MKNVASPTDRALRARLAAHTMHGMGLTNTAPAREKFLERFEKQVDPDGKLTPTERSRRAEHAKKAYFLGLALKSAKARRRVAPEGGAA